MVFVCTHERADEKACNNSCADNNCGTFWVNLLRQEVEKRGLKGKVRIVKSGCLDVCAAGPNLMIVDESAEPTWLNHLQESDHPTVLKKIFSD